MGVRPDRPRFTVVLPVRDRAAVVGRAVASVLAQTFADLELVVVDLGSTDRTLDAVRAASDERVVVVDGPADGPGCVAGLRVARGAWVALIDADCEAAAGWLARMGRLVDATGAGFASCGGFEHDEHGGHVEVRPVAGRDGNRACLRPGAFVTTTDRLRAVVDVLGEDLAERPARRRSDLASDPDRLGCAGHLGRAALDLTLLDGDPVVASPELLVAWYEPEPSSPTTTVVDQVDEVRLRVAFQGLDALARTPIPDGELLARYATNGGFAAARLRQRRDARRLFRIAWRARPEVRDHWSNLVASHLGPFGQRMRAEPDTNG